MLPGLDQAIMIEIDTDLEVALIDQIEEEDREVGPTDLTEEKNPEDLTDPDPDLMSTEEELIDLVPVLEDLREIEEDD